MNNFLPDVKVITILLLGHLFGDFVFQTDKIYRFKLKGVNGLFLHSFFVFTTTFIFLLYFSKNFISSLILSILTFITHFLIDFLKVRNRYNIEVGLNFILDQILHFIVIILIGLISNYFVIGLKITPFQNKIIFLLNSLIFLLYFLKYFLLSLYEILKIKSINDKYYIFFEDFEKISIFICAYMHGYFFLLIPFLILPRIFYSIKNGVEYVFYDISISLILSIFLGIIFRKFTLSDPFSFIELFFISILSYLLFKIISFTVDGLISFTKRF